MDEAEGDLPDSSREDQRISMQCTEWSEPICRTERRAHINYGAASVSEGSKGSHLFLGGASARQVPWADAAMTGY
jgi:hypothetical protein